MYTEVYLNGCLIGSLPRPFKNLVPYLIYVGTTKTKENTFMGITPPSTRKVIGITTLNYSSLNIRSLPTLIKDIKINPYLKYRDFLCSNARLSYSQSTLVN